jgi:hypothetical protein
MPDEGAMPVSTIAQNLGPYGIKALVLQGGGALGSYQAGAHSALLEAGFARIGWQGSQSEPSTRPSSQATRSSSRCPDEFWETITTEIWSPWSGASEKSSLSLLASAQLAGAPQTPSVRCLMGQIAADQPRQPGVPSQRVQSFARSTSERPGKSKRPNVSQLQRGRGRRD